MARKKQRAPAALEPTIPGPADPASRSFRPGTVELILIALILLTLADAATSRYALNPDGVSYLDLAARLSVGDWGSYVQGYWSPAYPALIALISGAAGHTPATLLTDVHLLNGVAVIGALLLLWWWSRRRGGPLFARAAFASLFLVSSWLPRVEAVTPDVLLLALMVWLGYELLVEQGGRWVRVGVLSGAIYLVKTSAWPWLLLSIPLRLWGARDREGRNDVLRALPVTAVVMLCWIVPLSVKAGSPTFGSVGRLNYCWYLNGCDSRTPDEHLGRHVAYHEVAIDSSRSITWAKFDADRWTYEPWSDPTAWDAGVLARSSGAPKVAELVEYWVRVARRTFAVWLLALLAAVLIPWSFTEWSAGRRRWWSGEGRPVLVVGLLGLAGIFQFILIHPEPRLIAPYGILVALALLHGSATASSKVGVALRHLAGWFGLLLVGWFGYNKVKEGITTDGRLVTVLEAVASSDSVITSSGLSQARVVVIGPGIPAEGGAFFSGAHIVAQVLPRSALVLDALPPDELKALLRQEFGGMADIAWRTTLDGNVTFIAIPPR